MFVMDSGSFTAPRRRALIAAALVVGSLLLYANALPNPFLFDDVAVIENSRRVIGGELGRLVTEGYWEEGHIDLLYRPLVSLSFGLNWAVSQTPWSFRLVNLLLHVAVCLLVFGFVLDVFAARHGLLAAAVAAGLFALHPIHTEVLNPIFGRADLALTLFGLTAAWIWWRDGGPRATRSATRPVAASVCFAAALLCKESGIAIVGVVLLLDWWRSVCSSRSLGRAWWRRRVLRCYLPIAAVSASYLLLRRAVLGQLTSGAIRWFENPVVMPTEMLTDGASPFLVRWGTPVVTFARSLWLMFVPVPLVHDRSYPAFLPVTEPGDPRLWLGLLAVVLVGLACFVSCRRNRAVLVAIGLALIPYAVVSNTLVPIGTIFAERLLYMPSVGVCIVAGLLLERPLMRLAEQPTPRALLVGVLLGIVAAGFAWITVERNRDWRSAEALILSVGDGERASYKVLNAFADLELNRAEGFREAGNDQANDVARREALQRAQAYARRAALAVPQAWTPLARLGLAQMRSGQSEQAFSTLQRALEMGGGFDSRTLRSLATLATSLGRHADAATYLEQFIDAQPGLSGQGLANAHAGVALAWLLAGRPADVARAVEHAREAWALSSTPPVERILAAALLTSGAPEQALPHARRAARALPRTGSARLVLVHALIALGRDEEAANEAAAALAAIPPGDPSRPALERALSR